MKEKKCIMEAVLRVVSVRMKKMHKSANFFTAAVAALILAISVLLVVLYTKDAEIAYRVSSPAEVTVLIDGAVETPGEYRLPLGSRVQDALFMAGGVTEAGDADSVNLAAYAEDGDHITVEPKPPSPSARINVNTATAEELTRLPGIGTVKAQRIIEYRGSHGVFHSAFDLMGVNGIGEKTAEKLKDLIEF